MCENNPNYIYLLHTREFIRTNENIYKIGQTRQKNNKRLKQYPDGSILLFQMICNNCVNIEKIIIEKFKTQFEQVKKLNDANIGNEYFRGNYNDMIEVIYSTIKQSNILETYNVPELKQPAKSIKITCGDNRDELVDGIKYSLHPSNIEMVEHIKPQEVVETNSDTLEDMTIPELKEIAKNKNIKISGNKKEIINKISDEKYYCGKKYYCDKCQKNYKTRNSLFTHKKKYHEKTEYECDLCNKIFIMRWCYIKHKYSCGNTIISNNEIRHNNNYITNNNGVTTNNNCVIANSIIINNNFNNVKKGANTILK
jgi:hypothetical protein